MGLKASAVGRIGDSPRELANKHADMGRTGRGVYAKARNLRVLVRRFRMVRTQSEHGNLLICIEGFELAQVSSC
jgi:hypothetical protein